MLQRAGPDILAAVSAAGAGYSWLATVNEVAQLLATAVAIVAGLYAIKWHRAKISDIQRKVEEVDEKLKSQPCIRLECKRRITDAEED